MATTNLTGEGVRKSSYVCFIELTGDIHNQLVCLVVLNVFLSITAFLGEYSDPSRPSQGDFTSSAVQTLASQLGDNWSLWLVSLQNLFMFINWLSVVDEKWNICHYTFAVLRRTGYTLGSVSLLTLTAISVDRLLALLLGLRYRQVVTLKRTCVTVVAFWVFCIAVSAITFWYIPITAWSSYLVVPLCLATSIYSYTRIFHRLRLHQSRAQDNIEGLQPRRTIPLNIARYRKAVYSALWLQLTLVACYLPLLLVAPLAIQREVRGELSPRFYLAWQFAITVVYLNSSLNPILYCWKIRAVSQAVKQTIRQLCCSVCG